MLDRIRAGIAGTKEYGMEFYVMKNEGVIVGVGGLADPLPAIMSYAGTGQIQEN